MSLLLVFVIGSFYNATCINILLLFCLFTNSLVAVGPRIDALRPLEGLIPGVPAASKAPSTVKGYHSQFQKWKAWAASFPGVACFPASALHFSLYLISLVQSGYSFATINSAFYSANFFHNLCGVPNPCNSYSFVKAILEGCKRVSANLFHLKRGSLSALNIYMLLFKGLPESMLVFPISEMSVSVLFFSLASCALMRPVILGGVTLISRIRIFLCLSLEVKPSNMVLGQQG